VEAGWPRNTGSEAVSHKSKKKYKESSADDVRCSWVCLGGGKEREGNCSTLRGNFGKRCPLIQEKGVFGSLTWGVKYAEDFGRRMAAMGLP